MNSSRLPSGSRKYTLLPRPLVPSRRSGPTSIAMPCRPRCATALPVEPGQSKQRSLLPGATGTRATAAGTVPGRWTFSCCAEPVEHATVALDYLRTDDIAIEGVGARTIGHRDHDVIEPRRHRSYQR